MFTWIREKFGTVIISGIISFIAFVFVFTGFFSPKATRGLHEGAVAGTVNGDPISISDFNRELNRRMEFFKNIGGGKITDDQLKAFRIREGVFQELANRKLMAQEAQRQGLVPSDEEVREKIREIPAFQKENKFDIASYKQVLEGNHYTTVSFERLVREDISMQQWEGYFKDRVRVSDDEVRREFIVSQDKRNIKYVVMTTDSAKNAVTIDPKDIQKFLEDPNKLNLAKMKFDESKENLYKGQKFDVAKEAIARTILAGEKMDDLQKANLKLADQIVGMMSAGTAADKKVDALLKPYQLQVKTTGMVTRQSGYIPGIGESKELISDAFAPQSPIDSNQGGKPKKYLLAGRVVVGLVVDSKKPDLAQLERERASLFQQISTRKSKELYQEWMKKISSKAKIDMNPSVVGADAS